MPVSANGIVETTRRAAVLIGQEYGTVARADLMAGAREALDGGLDILIACANAGEVEKLGRLPILGAPMNPDLHMADALKTTRSGNLFVVFGEPDIELAEVDSDQLQITIHGVEVFKPQSGEIVSPALKVSSSGSSMTTMTRKASSCATPVSSAPVTPTNRSKQPFTLKSTKPPGRRCIPRRRAPSSRARSQTASR